jgi:molybdate transport system substrate-binding protein
LTLPLPHEIVTDMIPSLRRIVSGLFLIVIVALSSTAFGAEVRVFCTFGFQGAITQLGPQFERETGNKLILTFGSTGGVAARAKNGEPFDVIIVSDTAMADLIKLGKVVEQGRTDIARVGISVAIRRGAPRPDIGSVESFKAALLAAKSISYTNPVDGGFSGVYFAELVKRLGIAEKLAPKTKLARGGTSSGVLVASGEAEIAIQTTSDLVPTAGIELVGPLPAEIQHFTVLSAGIAAGAADPAAVKRLILLLASPIVYPVLRETGLEPPKCCGAH